MDTTTDHFTPLALRVRGNNGYIAGSDLVILIRGLGGGGVSLALLLFKLSFCFFLYPLSAPFLNPLSSPFPHFP